jgi:hypothetical protein
MYWRKFGLFSYVSRSALRGLLAVVSAFIFAGCFSSSLYAQDVKPAQATPIDVKKAQLGGEPWDPQWDLLIEQNIPPEMLSLQVPKDVRRLCPNFYNMSDTDKRAFWAYFFQALAGAEAGLDPTKRVRHGERQISRIDPVTRQVVRSEGLLQLSYWDQKRYSCDFDWEHDKQLKPDDPDRTILQPKNNLQCGIRILENQIIDQRRPLMTKKSYWEPLQPGAYAHQSFLKQMTNPPEACAAKVQSKIAKAKTTRSVKQEADQKQVAAPQKAAGGDKQVASEQP